MVKLRVLNSHRDVWKAFKTDWSSCWACEIGAYADNYVHVRGWYPAPVLFIGEAPGRDEDRKGYPFVGKAGKILDALVDGLNIRWAVINTVACRPCDNANGPNRQPTNLEIGKCQERVERLLRAIDPRMVINLGKVAEACSYLGTWMLPTLNARHPAYIARLGGVNSRAFKQQRESIHAFIKKEIKTDKRFQKNRPHKT